MKQDMNVSVSHGVTSNLKTHTVETQARPQAKSQWSSTRTYHELADFPVREVDLFDAVEANLAQLEELQARMRFMVREVKYLLKA